MPLTIIHKHSDATTAGVADPPLNTDLASGELGINFSADDPALYIVDNANNVRKIQGTPNRKFTLQNDDVNLVGGDTTTAINAALVSGAIITSVASLLISDQVEVQDSGNPDANANVTVGRYFYDGAIWFSSGGGGGASVTVGDTAPASPAAGDLWWDSSEAAGSNGGRLYLWYEDGDSNQWVQTSNVGGGGGGGSSVSVGDTAPTSPKAGDLWWDSADDGGRLWVWYEDADSNQWVEASPNQVGSSFWSRDDATTTVSPSTAGDSVDIGSGNIELNADGSVVVGKFTGSTTGLPGYSFQYDVDGLARFALGKQTIGGNDVGYMRFQHLTGGGTTNYTDIFQSNDSLLISTASHVGIGSGASPNITLNGSGSASFYRQTTTGSNSILHVQSDVNGAQSLAFYVEANGRIYARNTTITAIASERRLKENIVSIDPDTAWETIRSTPFYSYNFIGSGSVNYGPIVDEVPDEMKMATDQSDDVGVIHTYDNGMLQARLYTALQTALTRIEALEAEVTALKGGTTK
jgi:hypothetical protein